MGVSHYVYIGPFIKYKEPVIERIKKEHFRVCVNSDCKSFNKNIGSAKFCPNCGTEGDKQTKETVENTGLSVQDALIEGGFREDCFDSWHNILMANHDAEYHKSFRSYDDEECGELNIDPESAKTQFMNDHKDEIEHLKNKGFELELIYGYYSYFW